MQVIPYRHEIDGLRAVAIIPVLLFHLGASWLPGGFTGVDVFFVISGYLITSIIIREQFLRTFSLSGFWIRRMRRILPALIAVTLFTLLAGYVFGYRNETGALGWQAIAALFSFANIHMWRQAGDYWGAAAEESPFLHCWSLSVEEQFYLFIPLLFILLNRYPLRWKLIAMAIVTFCSFLLFTIAASRYPSACFYLLPTRAWEIGIGCIAAFSKLSPNRITDFLESRSRWLAPTGLILIVGSFFLQPPGAVSLGLAFPTLGTLLIILCSSSQNATGRLLGHPIAVTIGKHSYSLYVWHWPLIVLGRQIYPELTGSTAAVTAVGVICCIIAAISYQTIERPLRNHQATPLFATLGVAVCSVITIFMIRSERSGNYDTAVFTAMDFNVHRYDNTPTISFSPEKKKKLEGVSADMRATEDDDGYKHEGILRHYGGTTPKVVVLGDSHATMWSEVIDEACSALDLTVSFWCAVGTNPFLTIPPDSVTPAPEGFTVEQKKQFDENRLKTIALWQPKIVVLSVRWSTLHDLDEAIPLIEFIGRQGSKVLIMEQPPEVAIGDRNSSQYLAYKGLGKGPESVEYFCQSNSAKVAHGRQIIRELARRYQHVEVLPLHDLYALDSKRAVVVENRNLVYYDDDHLSSYGAGKATERIKHALGKAL